ncbi:hypothetical protein [Pontimicrobium sp. MEBiC01747]
MKAKLKKVYVIFVALDFKNFNHYCLEPKPYYMDFEEAQRQLNYLIESKQYAQTQLKIQQLWKITENN